AVGMLAAKHSDVVDSFGKTLGSVADALEQGQQLQLADEAENGDTAFSENRLADAAAAYANALKADPADSRSRLLRAIACFELARAEEASAEMAEVVRREPE